MKLTNRRKKLLLKIMNWRLRTLRKRDSRLFVERHNVLIEIEETKLIIKKLHR